MQDIPREIEIYPIQHLPIVKVYGDKLGLVVLINHYVSTEITLTRAP